MYRCEPLLKFHNFRFCITPFHFRILHEGTGNIFLKISDFFTQIPLIELDSFFNNFRWKCLELHKDMSEKYVESFWNLRKTNTSLYVISCILKTIRNKSGEIFQTFSPVLLTHIHIINFFSNKCQERLQNTFIIKTTFQRT